MGIMTAVMFTDIDFRETVSDAPVGDSYDGGVSFWAFGSCIGEEDEVGDDGTAMKFDEHGGGIDTGAVGDDERDGGFNNHGVVGISYRRKSALVFRSWRPILYGLFVSWYFILVCGGVPMLHRNLLATGQFWLCHERMCRGQRRWFLVCG
jgi:hypothetical protein